jgi:uroporphyrin-3 C-methyltransferase
VFSTLMLLVALVALVLSGMLWQRLDRIQQELARQSNEALEISKEAKTVADTSETQSTELQARLSVAEIKLSEVSLQRSQLEELMLSVSRSRDDTLVMDIESGIRLAMQQAELTGNTQALVAALQAADKRIARAAQPRLNPIQRALARDMERVQTAAVVDVAAMALRLDELARLIDELPLRNAPPPNRRLPTKPSIAMPSVNGTTATPAAASVSTPITTPHSTLGTTPSNTTTSAAHLPISLSSLPTSNVSQGSQGLPVPLTSTEGLGEVASDPLMGIHSETTGVTNTLTVPPSTGESSAEIVPPATSHTRKKTKTAPPVAELSPPEQTWIGKVQAQWRRFWERVVQDVSTGSRDLVRVSRIDEPDAVLLAPEQSFFLRENLKLKLLNARLSLLSRQVPSARADLMATRAALQKYFDPQAINTRQAVQLLSDVLQGTKTVVLPRPDETLAALAKAAGGR